MGLQPLLVGMAVMFAVGATDEIAKEVEHSVRIVQTAFNQGDVDTLKGRMTADHMTILSYARFSNAADQLQVLSDFKFSDYTIGGLQVKVLTKDVALVSYQATIRGTYKGKEVPSPVQVVQVWVRRDRKWVQASYQETFVDQK